MEYDKNDSFALEFRLREMDEGLHRRFTNAVFGLQNILSNYKLIFPCFTDHTELHSLTVIDFSRRLIGNQLCKLNKHEIYSLLMGCYFHDTGMGISRRDFEEFSAKIDFGSYFDENREIVPEKVIRDFHNEFSALFIRKYADFFEFPSEAHLEAIIQISRGHRKTDLMDESVYPIAFPINDGSSVCLPYLSALVRLSDEIDVTAARNPIMLYDLESVTGEKNIIAHRLHQAVKKLEMTEDSFDMLADCTDKLISDNLNLLEDKMRRTLHECRRAVNGRTPYVITQSRINITETGK